MCVCVCELSSLVCHHWQRGSVLHVPCVAKPGLHDLNEFQLACMMCVWAGTLSMCHATNVVVHLGMLWVQSSSCW